MCGICGKISTQGKPVEYDLIRKMAEALIHRGPDHHGIHMDHAGNLSIGLGHQRLSIMDLSEAGCQPMSNEDRTIWMVFNGEIYNHREHAQILKHQGHRFRSDTDCEVVLHLYEEKGIDCLQDLNGMFSFALWDQNTRALYLCRDRAGIKPLVYSFDGQSLSFGSEIKSLLKDPGISRTLDPEALDLYLTFNYIPAPYTIYQHIRKLPPGSFLKFHNNEIRIEKYWDIPVAAPALKDLDFPEYQKRLAHLLEDAVRLQLMSDVPLGAFLSGGIDSSIIVGLMAKVSDRPVQTFSIGYDDISMFDESRYAHQVARHFRTAHHDIRMQSRDILGTVCGVLDGFDEPFADSSAIPTYIVSRETRRHVKVALSGDGADELFAGYRMYTGEYWHGLYRRIPSPLRKGVVEPLLRSLPDSRDKRILERIRRAKKFLEGADCGFEDRSFRWNQLFSETARRELVKNASAQSNYGELLHKASLARLDHDPINRMLYTDLTQSLPSDMLTKVDWMSMANSLEVRVPFLDHRVVELAFQMPGSWKMHKGHGKYILKQTFRNLLPDSILRKPKWGFEIPISRWLKSDLKFLIDEHLNPSVLERQGIFDAAPVKRLIDDHLTGRRDTAWQLWNLIVFQAWLSKSAR